MINLFKDVFITLDKNLLTKMTDPQLKVIALYSDNIDVRHWYTITYYSNNVVMIVTMDQFIEMLVVHYTNLFPKISADELEELVLLSIGSETGIYAPRGDVKELVNSDDRVSKSVSELPIAAEDIPYELAFVKFLNDPEIWRPVIDKQLVKLKMSTVAVLQKELIRKLLNRNTRLGFGIVGRSFTVSEYAELLGSNPDFSWYKRYVKNHTNFHPELTPELVQKLVMEYLLPSTKHYMIDRPYDPDLYFIDVKETYLRFYPALFDENNDRLLEMLVGARANIMHSSENRMNETLCEHLIKLYLDDHPLGKIIVS